MNITLKTLSSAEPQQAILRLLLVNGVMIEKVEGTDILELRLQDSTAFVIAGYLPTIPYNIGLILSNKNFIKKVLKEQKISVAEGSVISPGDIHGVTESAEKLGFPVLLRQENTQRTEPTVLNIIDNDRLITAFKKLSEIGESILIERQMAGSAYKVFYHSSGFLSVLEKTSRQQSFITTSAKLNLQANAYFEEQAYRELTLDMGDNLKKIAKKVLNAFPGLTYISFGLMTTDPNQCSEYVVTEVYHSAKMHYQFMAHKGKQKKKVSQLIAQSVIDSMNSHASH